LKENQHEEVQKGLVVLGKSTFEMETKSCAFLWDGLTYNFFEVAPLVCKQWENVVFAIDNLWQAFPWIFFLGLFIQNVLVFLMTKNLLCVISFLWPLDRPMKIKLFFSCEIIFCKLEVHYVSKLRNLNTLLQHGI
jgi:hypothetical protein